MNLEGGLEQRVSLFKTNYVHSCRGSALVDERDEPGKASLQCRFPTALRCLALTPEEALLGRVLTNPKVADGLLLLELPDGSWEAHIIELKRKIDETKWRDRVKRQFQGSLLQLHMLNGVLELPIARVVCHTAFQRDELSVARSPNPGLIKLPVGPDQSPRTSAEPRALLEARAEWTGPSIRLEHINTPLEHRRIQLDPNTATAEIDLLPAGRPRVVS